jgi:hypothetical protein
LQKLFSPDESSVERVGHRLLQLLFGHAADRDLEKGPKRPGDAKTGAFLDVFRGKKCLVEDAPGGRVLAELRRDGQVDLRGE